MVGAGDVAAGGLGVGDEVELSSLHVQRHALQHVEWITDAKSDDTRARRLQTAIEWMAEGKPRNWKYMRM